MAIPEALQKKDFNACPHERVRDVRGPRIGTVAPNARPKAYIYRCCVTQQCECQECGDNLSGNVAGYGSQNAEPITPESHADDLQDQRYSAHAGKPAEILQAAQVEQREGAKNLNRNVYSQQYSLL